MLAPRAPIQCDRHMIVVWIGGLLGSIGTLFGGSSGGASSVAAGASGAAEFASAVAGLGSGASFASNFSLAAMHSGGIVGLDAGFRTLSLPLDALDALPRYHTGLGANEFAAVLQRGERVLTEQQQQQIGAAANNNDGSGGPPLHLAVNVSGTGDRDTIAEPGSRLPVPLWMR